MSKNLEDKITIVVPCKNEENYIAHLLMHLRQQEIGNTRIIIADCSTDNTREVIDGIFTKIKFSKSKAGLKRTLSRD